MAELYIPIPAASQTSLISKPIDHQFSSELVISPKNCGVGCGMIVLINIKNEMAIHII